MRKKLVVSLIIVACVLGIVLQYVVYQAGYLHGVKDALNTLSAAQKETAQSEISNAEKLSDSETENQSMSAENSESSSPATSPTTSPTPEPEEPDESENAAATPAPTATPTPTATATATATPTLAPSSEPESEEQSLADTSSDDTEIENITTVDRFFVTKVKVEAKKETSSLQYFDISVRNDTKEQIYSLDLYYSLLDENMNIIATGNQNERNQVAPGQSISFSCWEYVADVANVKYILADELIYNSGNPGVDSTRWCTYFTVSYEPAPFTEGEYTYQVVDSETAVIR